MHASHAGFGPMLDSTSSAPPIPEVGDTVNGRYRLDREAGRTEAGVVFDATDRTISRRVVVELASSLEEPAARRKWARDAMQAQRLEGEHVLRVLDVGYVGESLPYVVREAAICTLTAELAARGPLPIPQAVAWTLEACEALAEAHALGMAHGDLRPDNVYIARGRTEATLKVGWTSAAKAERAAKEDIARDLAGLGAMLKILVTGQLDDENEGATTLPSELAHAVARALAQDPDATFHNVAELARALAPFAPPGHTSARTVAFLLSRAGIVGAAIPAAPAPAKPVADRASFTDEWFARASRTSLVFAEPGSERRRMSFALVSLALVAMVIGGSWFLWQTGKLPHWSGTAPPEPVGTTEVTSGAPASEPAADPNANASTNANPATPAVPVPATEAASTPVEALPNVDKAPATAPTAAATAALAPATATAAPAPQPQPQPQPQTQAPVAKTPAHAPVTSAPPSPPRATEPRNVDRTEAPAAEESAPAEAPTSAPEPVSPEPAPAPQSAPAPQPLPDPGPGY